MNSPPHSQADTAQDAIELANEIEILSAPVLLDLYLFSDQRALIVKALRSYAQSGVQTEEANPRVVDNDSGDISVSLNGKELRGWSYASDTERRAKMLAAREYVEGWCDGRQA